MFDWFSDSYERRIIKLLTIGVKQQLLFINSIERNLVPAIDRLTQAVDRLTVAVDGLPPPPPNQEAAIEAQAIRVEAQAARVESYNQGGGIPALLKAGTKPASTEAPPGS